jgi:hypothetical protein
LLIHLSIDGHLGYFYLFSFVNDAALNIGVQTPIQVPALNSFGYKHLVVDLLGHMVFHV